MHTRVSAGTETRKSGRSFCFSILLLTWLFTTSSAAPLMKAHTPFPREQGSDISTEGAGNATSFLSSAARALEEDVCAAQVQEAAASAKTEAASAKAEALHAKAEAASAKAEAADLRRLFDSMMDPAPAAAPARLGLAKEPAPLRVQLDREPGRNGPVAGEGESTTFRDVRPEVKSRSAPVRPLGRRALTNGQLITQIGEYCEDANQAINDHGALSTWDTSEVTDMSDLMPNACASSLGEGDPISFNADISSWDVSRVTTMARMFQGAISFNRDISGWDVRSVVDMESMFEGATTFNQDLPDWTGAFVS
jgi:surface protein